MKLVHINLRHPKSKYFEGFFKCEHCGWIWDGAGWDVPNYFNIIIPRMKCSKCDKSSNDKKE